MAAVAAGAAGLLGGKYALLKLLGMLGAWEALPYLKGVIGMTPAERRKYEFGKGELELQEKMFEATRKGAKQVTKRSQQRADVLMKQLMGMRQKETEESRYRYLTNIMVAKGAREDQMLMGLLASMMQGQQRMRPRVPSGMPLSMVELLRR